MTTRRATIVTDLAFGDCGKGTTVDYLARRALHTTGVPALVVRYNGGGQAAHNVTTDDGRHHTFAQFGSGSFSGAATYLSRFMLVDPLSLFNELDALERTLGNATLARLMIHADAMLVTPFHKWVNRLRDALREVPHGTCGMGIGEVMYDAEKRSHLVLRARDLQSEDLLLEKLHAIQDAKVDEMDVLIESATGPVPDMPRRVGSKEMKWMAKEWAFLHQCVRYDDVIQNASPDTEVIFEGAQGVLLDENWGFHPHTTWSTTTAANANTLLAETELEWDVTRLGVLRSYFTRHGAGPFPTESEESRSLLDREHNDDSGFQGKFRVGWFDMVLVRYAIDAYDANQPKLDGLVLTHMDRLMQSMPICFGYRDAGGMYDELPMGQGECHTERLLSKLTVPSLSVVSDVRFLSTIENQLHRPVVLTSYGPTPAAKFPR